MPTITKWVANAQATAQQIQGTVTACPAGGVLVATINGKTVSYVIVSGDTVTTAATAFFNLLASSTSPPEFLEETWTNPSAGVVLATSSVAGRPFAGVTGGLVFSATGGAGITQSQLTANSSPSDAADARNWLRDGVPSLPQNNDYLVVADSAVPILYNLDTAFPNAQLSGYTRYQSFTGTIGLPENNPAGYLEYRATYLKLRGGGIGGSSYSSPGGGVAAASLNVVLGFGGGGGPQRERYDFQSYQYNAAVLASGQPLDPYAIRLLGTNANSVINNLVGTTVAVAMLPGEAANLASAQVGAGGSLALGPAVTFTGTLTSTGGLTDVNCLVPTILCQNGAQLLQGTVASNLVIDYPSITLKNGTAATWLSGSNITSLDLQTRSTFDKGNDLRSMRINALRMEVDSCILNDPYNAITFAGPVTLVNALQSGPFRFAPGRVFTIT